MAHHEIRYHNIPSKFGEVRVVWRQDDHGPSVIEIVLPNRSTTTPHNVGGPLRHPALDPLCQAIDRFLLGEPVGFPMDLLDSSQCSPFQWQVLSAEMTIPRGSVGSYSSLAEHIGCPKAARAVGTALARNPFPLVIPCHRTVRSDGSLGGFGGGLDMKQALLQMEGVGFDSRGRVKPEFFWDWLVPS
jgi:methylated-DNA-[protein]-cysteine S-methyltransferase